MRLIKLVNSVHQHRQSKPSISGNTTGSRDTLSPQLGRTNTLPGSLTALRKPSQFITIGGNMAASHPSSLVSAHNSSDSGLQIHLHPLVLLTVSDLITRHILRQREGPIVGALLGQHNGRDMTLEHAFECQVIAGDPGHVLLHQDWFQTRLMQYKDVHKEPALELVGWFTATPSTGPEMQHVPIHRQIIQNYNETAVLLAFHPSEALAEAGKGGKLPLTIYESIYESTQSVGKSGRNDTDADQSMDVDGQEAPLDLKFR
ncbi:MAG: hypothetical protein LQ350_008100, partial [Teloschistes chrysophthalmus]